MVNIVKDRMQGYGYSIVSNGRSTGDMKLIEAQRVLSDEMGFKSADQVKWYIERLKKAIFGGRIESIRDRAIGTSGFRVTDDTGAVLMEETGWQMPDEVQTFIADLKAALLEGIQEGIATDKPTITFNQKKKPEVVVQPGLGLADLEKLGELRDKGILTEEEFTKKKTEILNNLKVE
jgi:Short C-terminal domain